MTHLNSAMPPATRDFYQIVLTSLTEARIPFVVGGAYALERYTGIRRYTKDLDVFVRANDARRVLELFAGMGYSTDLTFPHWLGKIYFDDSFADVIFSSGNGIAAVDDEWFAHAVQGTVLDIPVHLCPVEEMIWSKAFIMERERYDGADIAHLLRATANDIDWQRLLRRFGPHWRLLLSYLVLFGFIYPDERQRVPMAVMDELFAGLRAEQTGPMTKTNLSRGSLLSREQFLIDFQQWGYEDARLAPLGKMQPADVERRTDAIGEEEPKLMLHPTQ